MKLKRTATIGVAVGALRRVARGGGDHRPARRGAAGVRARRSRRTRAARRSTPKSRGCTTRLRPDVAPLAPARNLFAFREAKPLPPTAVAAGARRGAAVRAAAASSAVHARRHRRGSRRPGTRPHRDHLRRRTAVPGQGRRPRSRSATASRRSARTSWSSTDVEYRRRRPSRAQVAGRAGPPIMPIAIIINPISGGARPEAARRARRTRRGGDRGARRTGRGLRHRAAGACARAGEGGRRRGACGWWSPGAATARSTKWRRRSPSKTCRSGSCPPARATAWRASSESIRARSGRSPTRSARSRGRWTSASSTAACS